MKYPVYIDYPDDQGSYDFLPGERYGDDVVSRKLGTKATFVCNALAKISKGDAYEILLDSPEDVSAFILKCEYALIGKDKIQQYRRK